MGLIGTGQAMIDVVLQFFQEEQWYYQKVEDKPVIRAGYRGERGTWVCYARVDEEHQRFLFQAVTGMTIPAQHWPQVIDYLNRVNCGLVLGNFELDVDSGDIRFRVGIETPRGELTIDMVRVMAYTGVQTMDNYIPGVMTVIYSGLSPEAALARLETQPAETSQFA